MDNDVRAYDLDRFADEGYRLRVIENREAAQEKRRQTLHWVERVFVCALILALSISMLYSRSRLTALTDQVTTLEGTLVEERSVYDQLSYQLESGANLTNVEEYVTHHLGMVKTDREQVSYVSLADENRVEKAESGLAKYWNSLRQRLDEVLSYLKR